MAKIDYDIVIAGADNGFVLGVGCKRFVFTDAAVDIMLSDIKLYITGTAKERRAIHEKYCPDDFKLKGLSEGPYVEEPNAVPCEVRPQTLGMAQANRVC